MSWRTAGQEQRDNAVEVAIKRLREVAKREGQMPYQDFVDYVNREQAIRFTVDDFSHTGDDATILDLASIEGEKRGHGMLSIVVVLDREGIPGRGFFALARRMGKTVNPDSALSRMVFFVEETKRVYSLNQ
jgi:hypothetical protein